MTFTSFSEALKPVQVQELHHGFWEACRQTRQDLCPGSWDPLAFSKLEAYSKLHSSFVLIRVIRLRCLALASPWRWIWPCPTGNSLRSIASRRVSSQWMPWGTYGQMLPSSNIGPGSMHLRYWCVRVPMEFQSGLGFELGSAILRVLRDIWEQARGAKCASKPFLGSATRKATALSRSHTSARQYS